MGLPEGFQKGSQEFLGASKRGFGGYFRRVTGDFRLVPEGFQGDSGGIRKLTRKFQEIFRAVLMAFQDVSGFQVKSVMYPLERHLNSMNTPRTP